MLQVHQDQLRMMTSSLHQALCITEKIDQAKALAALLNEWAQSPMRRDEIFSEFGDAAGWTGVAS